MPLYMCNSVKGVIKNSDKPKIASDITDIHCEMTGAPRTFVHVFFFENAPEPPLIDASIYLFGNIRAGRSIQQKQAMVKQMQIAIQQHTGLESHHITVDTTDVPAGWVMEGGTLLPEPGKEADWLKRHSNTA